MIHRDTNIIATLELHDTNKKAKNMMQKTNHDTNTIKKHDTNKTQT